MKVTLRSIDRSNYEECIRLTVSDEQKDFVAKNWYSLLQAAYEPNLYTRAIYEEEAMVGMLLYDYDEEIPGWSMSRFMIDQQYQNHGIGKQALRLFLEHFKAHIGNEDLYTSAELDNEVAIALYKAHGFVPLTPFSYETDGHIYQEIRMVKKHTL